MKQKKRFTIIHRGETHVHNGESAKPGIAGTLINMREREQALQVVGEPLTMAQLNSGDRILLVDGDNILILRDNSIILNESTVLSPQGTIQSAHRVGNFIVVVTDRGNELMWCNNGIYTILNINDALPELHLGAVEETALTASMPAYDFAQPYNSWQAPLNATDVNALAKLMRNAVFSLQTAASSQGRFTGVMLARYGVRLWDDSYLWLSQPVMIGNDIIRASYRSSATVTSSNGRFSGIEACDLSLNSYRLGISVTKGIAQQWLDLVKSIDILVSPVASITDNNSIDYRCATTTSSGTRRYILELGPRGRSTSAIMQPLLCCDWHVIATTSALEGTAFIATNTTVSSQHILPNVRCDVITTQLAASHTIDAGQCSNIMAPRTILPVGIVTMEHNGRLYEAPGEELFTIPWNVTPWLCGTFSQGTVNATIQVYLNTIDGEMVVTTHCQCPCGTTALNPFIAFPDERATHIAIAVGNKMWETDLTPLDGTNMAVYINSSLNDNTLVTGSIIDESNDNSLLNPGKVYVSMVANPLVRQWSTEVSGCDIIAMAPACRPIYSGGFGRYPLYLFTSQGIMALPQRANGDFAEPRLVSHQVIASDIMPVMGDDKIWFVSYFNGLCVLSGNKVTMVLENVNNISQMAWNNSERELWLTDYSGNVVVLMPSLNFYRRDILLGCLYSDSSHALAVKDDGSLLNLSVEVPAMKHVYYLSQPFSVNPLMMRQPVKISWNIFTPQPYQNDSFNSLTLTLRGERASSCHGYIINSVKVTGVVAAPLTRRVLHIPSRSLRLEIDAILSSGTMALPTFFGF